MGMYWSVPMPPNDTHLPEVMRARITPDKNGGFWLVVTSEDGNCHSVDFPCKMTHKELKEAFNHGLPDS